ncbi:unnamed protein product [Bursaphelenchus xylophilus]|uniref:(pine wood nematode) hypothetical protein n=1 Tax=Bursaphelenchus xylophilus TaxID=6326 RepID=A0A811K7F7_BURXY|nr:unnamed protein product [Bursaphelenchus xylophilus]CAG9088097.1 unnamed protein product [Bursaphelenchus xylophilus]
MFHFDGWSKPEHPGPPLDPEGLVENNGCSAGPNEPMPNKFMKEQETKVEHPSPPNEPGGPTSLTEPWSTGTLALHLIRRALLKITGARQNQMNQPPEQAQRSSPFKARYRRDKRKKYSSKNVPSQLFPADVYDEIIAPACPTPENTTSSGGQSPRNPSREYYPIFAVETCEYLENLQIDLHRFLEEFVDFACYNKLALCGRRRDIERFLPPREHAKRGEREPNELFPADVYDEIIAPACLYARTLNFFSWSKPSELILRPKWCYSFCPSRSPPLIFAHANELVYGSNIFKPQATDKKTKKRLRKGKKNKKKEKKIPWRSWRNKWCPGGPHRGKIRKKCIQYCLMVEEEARVKMKNKLLAEPCKRSIP